MFLARLPRPPRFSTACIVWLTLWFGVVVPGHERGQIVLPGYAAPSHCGTASSADASSAPKSTCCPVPEPDEPGKPADPITRCAVCYIVATLATPPPVDLAPQPTARVALLDQTPSLAPEVATPHRPWLGRAPPAII